MVTQEEEIEELKRRLRSLELFRLSLLVLVDEIVQVLKTIGEDKYAK